MKEEVFEELLESVRQAKAIERGELKPGRVFKFDPKNDVVKVRAKLKLSQSKFAAILGISEDTLQNWEQGRRCPTGPAKVLLRIARKHPHLLLETAASSTA
jgi:putative transcriptional regulator